MPEIRKLSSEAEAQAKLKNYLSKATPFIMGTTRFNGVDWLLLRVKTKESAPNVPEDELSSHRWSGLVIHDKRWLFLHVEIGNHMKKSFAFDGNDPTHLEFLRDLLRNRRIAIGFQNGKTIRLDPSPATALVEDFEEDLHLYIPDWQQCYKQA